MCGEVISTFCNVAKTKKFGSSHSEEQQAVHHSKCSSYNRVACVLLAVTAYNKDST